MSTEPSLFTDWVGILPVFGFVDKNGSPWFHRQFVRRCFVAHIHMFNQALKGIYDKDIDEDVMKYVITLAEYDAAKEDPEGPEFAQNRPSIQTILSSVDNTFKSKLIAVWDARATNIDKFSTMILGTKKEFKVTPELLKRVDGVQRRVMNGDTTTATVAEVTNTKELCGGIEVPQVRNRIRDLKTTLFPFWDPAECSESWLLSATKVWYSMPDLARASDDFYSSDQMGQFLRSMVFLATNKQHINKRALLKAATNPRAVALTPILEGRGQGDRLVRGYAEEMKNEILNKLKMHPDLELVFYSLATIQLAIFEKYTQSIPLFTHGYTSRNDNAMLNGMMEVPDVRSVITHYRNKRVDRSIANVYEKQELDSESAGTSSGAPVPPLGARNPPARQETKINLNPPPPLTPGAGSPPPPPGPKPVDPDLEYSKMSEAQQKQVLSALKEGVAYLVSDFTRNFLKILQGEMGTPVKPVSSAEPSAPGRKRAGASTPSATIRASKPAVRRGKVSVPGTACMYHSGSCMCQDQVYAMHGAVPR